MKETETPVVILSLKQLLDAFQRESKTLNDLVQVSYEMIHLIRNYDLSSKAVRAELENTMERIENIANGR